MLSLTELKKKLFHPLTPVMLFLFISITTLHEKIPFLLSLHIETLVFLWAIFNSILYFIITERKKIQYDNPVIKSALLGLLFAMTPLMSSFMNNDYFHVLSDEEYRTLFKMILFVPCLFLLIKDKKINEFIINFFLFSYTVFALYFLYRYLVLHEVREFDQRPLIKIRHGDPNFLCTFFSMMIPISLMQAWCYRQKKLFLPTFLYLLCSALLFICAFLTESRMGIIAVLLGLSYLITRPFLSIPKKGLIAIVILGVVAVSFISGDRLLKRYSEIEDKSNSDRYLTWVNGALLFFENPVFGVGIHNAQNSFYQNTGYPHFQNDFHQLEIHNTPLKVAAELGMVGLCFFSFIFLWPWKKALAMKSEKKYFLISSLSILTLSMMTIGIVYKDLFVLHLFTITLLAL